MFIALAVSGALGTVGRDVTAADGKASRQALPRNDRLFVLLRRAGPYRYLEGWRTGKPTDYGDAVRAFGQPTRAEPEFLEPLYDHHERTSGFCHVTWADAGITVRFFVFSEEWPPAEESHPPKIQPCARESLGDAFFTRLRLTGPGWRNRTGIEVGKSLPAGHRRAVKQRFDTKRFDWQQLTMWFEFDQQGRVRVIVADMFWPD